MKNWINKVLIGLLGLIIGVTLATILQQKELWLWDIPRMTKENEIAIKRMSKELPEIQDLLIRLKQTYNQIQEEWGRILNYQGAEEETNVSTGEN